MLINTITASVLIKAGHNSIKAPITLPVYILQNAAASGVGRLLTQVALDRGVRAPSSSEALVRMEYAPIDYSDLLLANGVYFLNPNLPSVIGGEGAGIVEAIGPGVTSVKVGDRVTIPFGTFTWSEKVLAPAQGLFVVPPSIDARTASMLNINPTTAVLLLDEFVKLKPKDWIVLNAANSQVARCLIAIAKSRDLNVVGIVRRSELIPEIEKLGVDFVGVESPELSKQIQIATGGMPISLGLDAVGGPATATMASVLSSGAHLVSYAQAEWFADSRAARRSHWQEVKHPRLLDVLRRVSPQNASGTD